MITRLLVSAIGLGLFVGVMVPTGQPPTDTAPTLAATVTAKPAPMQGAAINTVLERQSDGHFYADAMVNGQLVHFLVDTGASMVALTKADAQRVGLHFSPAEFTVIGRGASGDVRGKAVELDRVAVGMKEATGVRAAILDEGLGVSLLGQSFLSRIGTVTIVEDRMTLR